MIREVRGVRVFGNVPDIIVRAVVGLREALRRREMWDLLTCVDANRPAVELVVGPELTVDEFELIRERMREIGLELKRMFACDDFRIALIFVSGSR